MQRPTNLKVGDTFKVIEEDGIFKVGEIVSLDNDDNTNSPFFWKEDKSTCWRIFFSNLEPYAKTVRCAQVGDVVVDEICSDEHLVLERLQNTVVLSSCNDFKKASGNFTFDELEEHFTLKAEPEVVDTIAEAMKLLKEARYKIVKE